MKMPLSFVRLFREVLILVAMLCTLLVSAAAAEQLRFDSAADWASWNMPYGLVNISDDGRLQLIKFRRDVDVVEDAHLFSYESVERGTVNGGIWDSGSNAADAPLVIDGDAQTFWKPDPADEADDWFVDIDLGRAVLAKEIRLIFPDEEGARPFRQFSVYINTGTRILVKEDLLLYQPVFRTTQPNKETTITIPLRYPLRDSTLVVDPNFDVSQVDDRFRVVHHVLIVADDKNADAALAEIEVTGIGDNVSLGTLERGAFVNGRNAVDPQNLFDGDMNTLNTVTTSVVALTDFWQLGTWYRVDLGALFFIDDMFIYAFGEDEGLGGPSRIDGGGTGHTVLISDGERSLSTSLPGPDLFKYTELFTHEDPRSDNLFYIRYRFQPRKMRYIYWHGLSNRGFAILKWAEMMLFSPGHPASVTMQSDFIDLGAMAGDGRAKVIRSLEWDGAAPLGTKVQLRSRSGNTMGEKYTFFDRAGIVTTEEAWTSKPKVLRGPIDTTVVVSNDWDEWSNFYQLSGEPFKSQSPRRFVQLEMVLSTDDPQVAPEVDMLSINFEDALVQQARGGIWPRQTQTNTDTRFSYTLWTQTDTGDSGFDILRFIVPGPVSAESVEVEIGGITSIPSAVSVLGDSLFVVLPQKVAGDSVQVSFNTRVLEHASVFVLDLGDSERPGVWQSVEPVERRANVVLLPDLPNSNRLIDDLRIEPALFTPNGDGINDQLRISFVVLKLETANAQVQILDLTGRIVARLERAAVGERSAFVWSGRNAEGLLVPPGTYLCRIDLGADQGEDLTLRVVAVAY